MKVIKNLVRIAIESFLIDQEKKSQLLNRLLYESKRNGAVTDDQ